MWYLCRGLRRTSWLHEFTYSRQQLEQSDKGRVAIRPTGRRERTTQRRQLNAVGTRHPQQRRTDRQGEARRASRSFVHVYMRRPGLSRADGRTTYIDHGSRPPMWIVMTKLQIDLAPILHRIHPACTSSGSTLNDNDRASAQSSTYCCSTFYKLTPAHLTVGV